MTGVNEGIMALDRKSALAVGQRDARFDLNVSGNVMVWVVVVVNGSFDVVFCGVAKLDVREGELCSPLKQKQTKESYNRIVHMRGRLPERA